MESIELQTIFNGETIADCGDRTLTLYLILPA